MGKGTIKTKAMTMAVAMSMVAGLCPSTVFAANSEVVAKVQDGTYTGTAECTPDGDGEFTKYNLSLSVTVEDGKICKEDRWYNQWIQDKRKRFCKNRRSGKCTWLAWTCSFFARSRYGRLCLETQKKKIRLHDNL